jgi:hypothetical protein
MNETAGGRRYGDWTVAAGRRDDVNRKKIVATGVDFAWISARRLPSDRD